MVIIKNYAYMFMMAYIYTNSMYASSVSIPSESRDSKPFSWSSLTKSPESKGHEHPFECTLVANETIILMFPCSIDITIDAIASKTGKPRKVTGSWVCAQHKEGDERDVVIRRLQDRIIITTANEADLGYGQLRLTVPPESHLQATIKRGKTTVTGIPAYCNIQQDRGSITLYNVHPVSEHAISAHCHKGDIAFFTPIATQSYVHLHNMKGIISSELIVTLDPLAGKLSPSWWKEQRHGVNGRLGKGYKGQAYLTLETHNGSISISELTPALRKKLCN